ncbi:MAG: Arc/MetJ family transcription regulator [Cyclobacteriaceae bacterium]|jgi:Arc/MetJ family transcription regulator
MRTNIEIEDQLIADVMQKGQLKTKKEAVKKALEAYIQLLKRKEILTLKGGVDWQGDLDEMRSN